MLSPPDVLVLGGGGVLGESWLMGVLSGIEDASGFDLRRCEHFVGTSAGSIVAAHLAAGRSPRRPNAPGTELEPLRAPPAGASSAAITLAKRAGEWTLAAWAPFTPLALAAARPGGALLRAAILWRLESTERSLGDLSQRVEQSGARFDGRLRIAAVDHRTGRRIMFGAPGAPQASVAQAVEASCTVPWLFSPVEIGGSVYVDGGVWSPTNLDAAPAGRDTHVLCLSPTAGINGPNRFVSIARGLSRSVTSVEALALRGRGAIVRTIAPSRDSAKEIGPDLMDPEPRQRVLAAGYRQGLSVVGDKHRLAA